MPHSGKFTRADLGAAPLGRLERIIDYCEGAGVTQKQGKTVLLYCLGWSYYWIARGADIRAKDVRATLDAAARRISREYPRFQRFSPPEPWFWAVIWCFRNRGDGGKRPLLMERRRGVIDTYTRPALVLPEDIAPENPDPDEVFLLLVREADRPPVGTCAYAKS